MSLQFPRNVPNWEHCGQRGLYILNVPVQNTSGTLFWFFLNFPDWGHCDHTIGNTGKYTVNEPLRNIEGTFFGDIQGVPMDYLIRTLQSHDLGNWGLTEGFL